MITRPVCEELRDYGAVIALEVCAMEQHGPDKTKRRTRNRSEGVPARACSRGCESVTIGRTHDLSYHGPAMVNGDRSRYQSVASQRVLGWGCCAVLVTALLLALLVPSAAGYRGDVYSACLIRCCAFTPACNNASSMTCSCPNTDQLTLRRGSIPETVQDVHITQVRYVTVGRGALLNLHQLRELSIRSARHLQLSADSLSFRRSDRLQRVSLSDVEQLHLDSDALSGSWPPHVQLSVQSVGRLRLARLAVHMEAAAPAPRLLLEHIGRLSAARRAFSAQLSQLSLVNVSMQLCPPDTFSGRVHNLEVLGSRLHSFETGCYRPRAPVARLAFRTSSLGAVASDALVGNASQLLFEACNISYMSTGAVQMRVHSLELKTTAVGELEPRALQVVAEHSITLRDWRVNVLHTSALAGLLARRPDDADASPLEMRPFSLHMVHIGRAMDGGLAVHAAMQPHQLNWDSLVFEEECSCALTSRLRHLVTAGPEPPGRADQLTALVYDAGYCSAGGGGGSPVPLSQSGAACPSHRPPPPPADDAADSPHQRVVFYAVACGAALGGLLLLLAAAVACVRHRRRRRRRRRSAASTSGTATPPRYTAPPAAKLPDLLQPPPQQQQGEHIYAEISAAAPPALAEYADPRDACTPPPAPAASRGVYAELSPLLEPAQPSGGSAPTAETAQRPAAPAPPPLAAMPVHGAHHAATLPVALADNELYDSRPGVVAVTDV